MNVISLFSGAGGIDFGFEAAGFQTRLAVDSDPSCRSFLEENTDWNIPELGDVLSLSAARVKSEASIGRGQVDVLIGGPPCQPYSKAGYWHSGDAPRLKDARAKTLDGMLALVEDLLPEVVLIENVPGLGFSGKDEGLRRIKSRFYEINRATGSKYKPVIAVLDAASFGVPQHRSRLFVVAVRSGLKFEFPAPTHGKDLSPYRHCWDAFHGLASPDVEGLKVTGKWAELLPSVPPGKNYLWHTDRGEGSPLFGWRTRYWSFLLKLAPELPSWTLSASPGSSTGPFHWESRKLSIPELVRLQTFPDHLRFACSYRVAVRMLGNAVPSLLAEVLARSIGEQVFGMSFRHPPSLSVPLNHVPPPQTKSLDLVPARFLEVECAPQAHPGEGAGPGAMRRRAALVR